MKKALVGFLWVVLCFSFLGCRPNPDKTFLETAQRLVEEFPDSAALYLDSIVSLEKMKVRDQHLYQLLNVQIKDKLHKSLAQDTCLFRLRGIYDKSDPAMASAIYYYSARIYEEQYKYKEAMEECLKVERFAETMSRKQKGIVQNTMGRMYLRQALMEKAREKFRKSLVHFQDIRDFASECIVYNQISISYLMEEDIDSTLLYCEKCIERLDSCSNYMQMASILSDLSLIYITLGDDEKANSCLERALAFPMNSLELAKVNLNLAKINTHNPTQAYKYIKDALKFADKEDLLFFANLYSFQSSLEEKQRKYESALNSYKQHNFHLKEYLEKNFVISMSDIKYQHQISNLKNKLTIKKLHSLIVVLVFMILLSASLGFIYKQQRNLTLANNLILHLQKMSLEYNEQEKSLKNIVLKHFNLLKKVALLENYMVHNATNSRFVRKLHEIVYDQEVMDWDSLYETMNSLHNNLFNKIREEFSVLNDHDFKICCLTIARLSNSEIGIILNNAASTIQYRKTYIRKKLNIPHQGNLRDFFKEYFSDKS